MTTKIMAPDIPNSDAVAELRTRAEATCDRYGVQRREQCVNAFLRLAESFRWRTMPPPEIEEGTLEQLKRLRDAASRLSKALRSLDEESAALLPEFLRKDLPTHKLFCESLHSVSRQLSAPGASREHEVKELIAKQFIVTCQQFRIPIKWSKEFEYHSVNSKNEPSAYLLGAIYAAGGMKTDAETTPAHRANHYLGRFSKGFTVAIDGVVVRVLLKKTVIEPNLYMSQIMKAVSEGREPTLPTSSILTASCQGYELGLSRPFCETFYWHS